jgi:hypothetical protein
VQLIINDKSFIRRVFIARDTWLFGEERKKNIIRSIRLTRAARHFFLFPLAVVVVNIGFALYYCIPSRAVTTKKERSSRVLPVTKWCPIEKVVVVVVVAGRGKKVELDFQIPPCVGRSKMCVATTLPPKMMGTFSATAFNRSHPNIQHVGCPKIPKGNDPLPFGSLAPKKNATS